MALENIVVCWRPLRGATNSHLVFFRVSDTLCHFPVTVRVFCGVLEILFFTICDLHQRFVSFLWQGWIATELCCRNMKRNFSNFKAAAPGQESQEFCPLILMASGQWRNKSKAPPNISINDDWWLLQSK